MARELSSGPGLRTAALLEPLLALGGGDAIAAVLDLAGNSNNFLRAKAMQALGKFRIAAAFERLTAGLLNSDTGGFVADALVQIDRQGGKTASVISVSSVAEENHHFATEDTENTEPKLDRIVSFSATKKT